ncbi:LysR family transcriptional regulator [Indioceanicola profundi]|uniref:LysR family transcriptional regulator n=1 Tax=Indioceanicola profundi TaxID=2220096 RepID=UPI001CEC0895|nr:LysR family transcriptional regulator [Indioceanicola profundi]
MDRYFDLNILMILTVLLQTKSVTKTAKRLGLSQPTVSRALAQMRTRVGDPLLVRTSSGMELTRRAEDLRTPLQHWLANTSTLLEPAQFDPATLQRRFRVASTDFGVAAVVAPALPHILDQAPSATLDVVPFSDSMMQRLVSGDIDLIITGLEPDRQAAHVRFLFSERFSCLLRRDHPLLTGNGATSLPLDLFLKWPQISVVVGSDEFDRIDLLLGERARERRVIARLPYFQAAPSLLGRSDAIMTLPTRSAEMLAAFHGFVCLRAPAEIPGFDYHLLWHERSHRDPAIQWLADQLSAHCACLPQPAE